MWLLIFLGISVISLFHSQVEGKKKVNMKEVHEDENEVEEDKNNEEEVHEEEGEEEGDEEEDEEVGDDEEDEGYPNEEEGNKQNNCNPLQPSDDVQPHDCCSAKLFPIEFVRYRKICLKEAPDLKDDLQCLMECIFAFSELLTDNFMLNINKVKTAFYHDKGAPGAQSIKKTIDRSLVKNKEVNKALTSKRVRCKSGAYEFSLDIMREVFLQCPAKLWNDSDECFALGVKLQYCHRLPVFM